MPPRAKPRPRSALRLRGLSAAAVLSCSHCHRQPVVPAPCGAARPQQRAGMALACACRHAASPAKKERSGRTAPEVSQRVRARQGDPNFCFAAYLWHSWAVRGLSANPSVFVYMCARVPAAEVAGPAGEWTLSRAVMLNAELFSPGQDYRNDLGS